jgi:tRNA-5-taurinomethyluridine 2-sulfurtransferase
VRLEVVPLTEQYWDQVVCHSIAEIKSGRTPNPDVLCNSRRAHRSRIAHKRTAR